ncbi:MAG: DUF3617 domain-containing protein [Lautropia sp.]
MPASTLLLPAVRRAGRLPTVRWAALVAMLAAGAFGPGHAAGASPTVLAQAPGGAGYALGHPRRRPGLWEIRSTANDNVGMPPTRFCVGEETDRPERHLDRVAGEKGSCTIGGFKRVGITWIAETVCRDNRTTVISQSVASGDFLSEYRIDTLVFYSPPLANGKREDKDSVSGRYLGPCAPGQRAGDLEVPGMGTLNMTDGTLKPEAGKAASPGRGAGGQAGKGPRP